MSRSRPVWKSASHRTSRPGVVLPVACCWVCPWASAILRSQPAGQSAATSDENAQARRWFEDAKFGLFIHWGVYSLWARASG